MTRPSDSKQGKRTCRIVNFAVPADHRVKLKESETRDNYLDLSRELKKTMNGHTVTKGLKRGLEDLKIRDTSGEYPNYSMVEIGQNPEKSPGDLRRPAATQIFVEDHQQTLV